MTFVLDKLLRLLDLFVLVEFPQISVIYLFAGI